MATIENWEKGFGHYGYETMVQEPKPADNPFRAPEIPGVSFLIIKRGGDPLAYLQINAHFYDAPESVVAETINRTVTEMAEGQVYARCRQCAARLLVDRHRPAILTTDITQDTPLPSPGLGNLYDFRDFRKGPASELIMNCPTCDQVLHYVTIKFVEPYVCEKGKTDEQASGSGL